uniref:Uncharacterized protein n=1 Tax=Calidris pygmaea TaxID=425635 RepID=A0A8C3KBH6_9CHAR
RGRGLVEQQGHGLRLLGLGDQHGVAAQHHRLVLQLVAVDPVGDPVQQVEVAGPAQPLVLGVGHADALRAMPGQCEDHGGGGATGRWPWVPLGARRVMLAQLGVPQPGGSPGAGAVLLGGAVAVAAHLRHRCFSVSEGGTPRFLPRRFLRPQL